MKKWYTKELGVLADVSVRTLHHYDKIGLLTPSIRTDKNYRLYSEEDLLRLQQIIALKFFGFDLSQIKNILDSQQDVIDNFKFQSKFLQEKANALLSASDILKQLTKDCKGQKSIPWQKTMKLIEVFQMTKQLEHNWVKEIFNQDELKQYAEFEATLTTGKTKHQKEAFEKRWRTLVEEINQHISTDPSSKEGMRLGGEFMAWVNDVYGKKYAHLRTKKFEQGFGEGKGLEEVGLTPETVEWIDQASDAYWRERVTNILSQVNKTPSSELEVLWNILLDEMYGYDKERKISMIETVLKESSLSDEEIVWLKSLKI